MDVFLLFEWWGSQSLCHTNGFTRNNDFLKVPVSNSGKGMTVLANANSVTGACRPPCRTREHPRADSCEGRQAVGVRQIVEGGRSESVAGPADLVVPTLDGHSCRRDVPGSIDYPTWGSSLRGNPCGGDSSLSGVTGLPWGPEPRHRISGPPSGIALRRGRRRRGLPLGLRCYRKPGQPP